MEATMADNFKTIQEQYWAGKSGNDYIERNKVYWKEASAIAFFSEIFSRTSSVKSVFEFGANIGLNLKAIHQLIPEIALAALEINAEAVKKLEELGYVITIHDSALNHEVSSTYDFVLSKTFLIHINPEMLPALYQKIYASSKRYICLAEYYNPVPVSIEYRGEKDILFKRDFAGDFLDMYDDLKLIDYGFCYHRDNNFKQDDVTWFLLEKDNIGCA
jgi:pseudaminic acid biosynthesis-associated methylase